MAKIKMRVHDDTEGKCAACGCNTKQVLDMFDVKIGKHNPFCICDKCMDELFHCSLKASCYTDGRKKDQKDINIKNVRSRKERKRKEKKDGIQESGRKTKHSK